MKNFFGKTMGFVLENKKAILKGAGIAVLGGAVLGGLKYTGDKYQDEELEDYECNTIDSTMEESVPTDEA